ncbi:unnamed protein product [Cercospora beticola]|nr:unnamed protein product [Cercospora beticola]
MQDTIAPPPQATITSPTIPHLSTTGNCQQLIIHNKPFLVLGGEVQNSQFSSASYMKPIWPKLKAANINTVFGAVTWEQIEPTEGGSVFDELDRIVYDAREEGLKLVLLWFGGFKNALSTYAPSWVKRDAKRFPRAELRTADGQMLADAVSIFHPAAREADAKAFKALMQHIKEIDEGHSTIVMVQVENEVGLLGDSVDRSAPAVEAWKQPLPADFLRIIHQQWSQLNEPFWKNFHHLQFVNAAKNKTWKDLSNGDEEGLTVHELFMAYHFSQYVETVAAAGKAVYPLPLFTYVWQNYAEETQDSTEDSPAMVAGGGQPGDYPSGGGVSNVLDIWKLFAPSLDLIAPDIYLNDYEASCKAYRHRGQGLLIPEQRRDDYGARRIWQAFGSHRCIGTAPFGVDSLEVEELEKVWGKHYGLLSKVSKYVLAAQIRKDACAGFFFDELREDGSDPSSPKEMEFEDWNLRVERAHVFGRPSAGSGMAVHLDQNEFLLIGWGFQVSFTAKNGKAKFNGISRFEEKEVDVKTGELRTLRLLNGDETRSGKFAVMPSESPDYGGFPIAITIPANTGIAVVEPYALE